MVRWIGFADLTFPESARLAFDRAAELAETEAHAELPDAWVIEDRRITFSIETDSNRPMIEGIKRMLGALVMLATAGEAHIEVHTSAGSSGTVQERWARKASTPSVSKEIAVTEDETAPETIRTAAS